MSEVPAKRKPTLDCPECKQSMPRQTKVCKSLVDGKVCGHLFTDSEKGKAGKPNKAVKKPLTTAQVLEIASFMSSITKKFPSITRADILEVVDFLFEEYK